MKIIMLIIIFLMIGALFIISENNINLREKSARNDFKVLYLSWFNQLFGNTKNIIGYVVKFDWLPEK